jgi:hypothetical protein
MEAWSVHYRDIQKFVQFSEHENYTPKHSQKFSTKLTQNYTYYRPLESPGFSNYFTYRCYYLGRGAYKVVAENIFRS